MVRGAVEGDAERLASDERASPAPSTGTIAALWDAELDVDVVDGELLPRRAPASTRSQPARRAGS